MNGLGTRNPESLELFRPHAERIAAKVYGAIDPSIFDLITLVAGILMELFDKCVDAGWQPSNRVPRIFRMRIFGWFVAWQLANVYSRHLPREHRHREWEFAWATLDYARENRNNDAEIIMLAEAVRRPDAPSEDELEPLL